MIRFLLIPLLFIFLGNTAYGFEASFQSSAHVNESVVRLRDIVRFDKQSGVTDSLGSQVVAQAPAPGEECTLNAKHVLRQLRQLITSLPAESMWKGVSVITIHRDGVNISSRRILNIIDDYIEGHKNVLPEADIHFKPVSLPMPFVLPTGTLATEVIPSDPEILGSSRFSIIFRVDGDVVKNMSVRGQLEAIGQVVVAAERLARNTVLQPQHLRISQQDISGLRGFASSLDQVVGKKLTRTLRQGSPLLDSMLAALPVVHRGDKVKIVISSGPMLLTATGVAFKDGLVNQMIRVQNLSSKKIVYCRVAAPGIVEVIL